MAMPPDGGYMVTYQFEVDDDLWSEWKDTVPRSKSLDTRLRELIEADAEGRVREEEPEKVDENGEQAEEPAPAGDQATEDGVRQRLEDAIRNVDWKNESNYAKQESRVLAVADALWLLRENHTAKTPTLVEKLEEHELDLNYSRLLSDIAGELEFVETPVPGSNKYTWLRDP